MGAFNGVASELSDGLFAIAMTLIVLHHLSHRHAGLWAQSALLGLTVGQSLYALGVLLCIVSTFLSIAFIFLVQINYAVAPGHKRTLP